MIPGISANPYQGRPDNPRHLFRARQDGWILDPADHSTLWIDEARTQNATLPGDVVWWIDDKSPNQNHFGAVSSAARGRLYRWPASAVLEGYPRNRVINSSDPTQSGWTARGVGVSNVSGFWRVTKEGDGEGSWGALSADNAFGLAASSATGTGYFRILRGNTRYVFLQSKRSFLTAPDKRTIFDLDTLTVTANTFGDTAVDAGIVDLGGNEYLLWVTATIDTASGTSSQFGIGTCRSSSDIRTALNGDYVDVAEAQVTFGTEIRPYQRVGSGIWDVTEEGQEDCWGIGFDGVTTQYLSTRGNANFVGDYASICVGQTKIGADTAGAAIVIANAGGASDADHAALFAPGVDDSYWARYRSSQTSSAKTGLAHPSPHSAILDQGVVAAQGQTTLRVNADPSIASTPGVSGAINSSRWAMGSYRGGGLYYSGIIWGSILVAEEPDPVVWEQSARQWLSNRNMGGILDV